MILDWYLFAFRQRPFIAGFTYDTKDHVLFLYPNLDVNWEFSKS